jgi:hypothetical protein
MVDYHFVAMSPLCIGSLLDFCRLFAFVFSLGCVYFYSHLAHTFDGNRPILDFLFTWFFFFFQRYKECGMKCPGLGGFSMMVKTNYLAS